MIVEVSIIIIHSAAISALEKAQEWQLALGLLSVIVKANTINRFSVRPSVLSKRHNKVATRIGLAQRGRGGEHTIIHNAAISALEKAQEWQLALGLLSVTVKANIINMFFQCGPQ